MKEHMESRAREGGENKKPEDVDVILKRIEKKVNAISERVIRLERVLKNAAVPVCEPPSAYQAEVREVQEVQEVQKETNLMADYILDEAGRVTNIQFNLVKKL